MKEINWKEVLQMFCDDEDKLNDWRQKPFLNKATDEVWATEGHVVLMVKTRLCGSDFATIRKRLILPKVLPGSDQIMFTTNLLRVALNKCPHEEIFEVDSEEKRCPECRGSGMVSWHYTAIYGSERYYDYEFECPVCDGEGVLEKERNHPTGEYQLTEDAAVSIGVGVYKALQMERILKCAEMVGAKDITIVSIIKPNDMVLMQLVDGVRVGLMPFISVENAVPVL